MQNVNEIEAQLAELDKKKAELKKQKVVIKAKEKELKQLFPEMLSEIRTEGSKLHDSDKTVLQKIDAIGAIVNKYVSKVDQDDPVPAYEVPEAPAEKPAEKKRNSK